MSSPSLAVPLRESRSLVPSPSSERLPISASDNGAEWIKGLLAVPFVLHSQPTGVFESRSGTVAQMAEVAHRRYAEIMKDVEEMIDDHSISILGRLPGNTHVQPSCAPTGRTPWAVQAQVAGTIDWYLLYPASARRCFRISG